MFWLRNKKNFFGKVFFAFWEIFHDLLLSAHFFQNQLFSKNSLWNISRISSECEKVLIQIRQRPDILSGLIRIQKLFESLSADNTDRQRVKNDCLSNADPDQTAWSKLFANKPISLYESLEGPLLKKKNIFYLVITRKLTRNNEITNSL